MVRAMQCLSRCAQIVREPWFLSALVSQNVVVPGARAAGIGARDAE